VAENKVGIGESEIVNVTTNQAEPDDIYAPEWTSENKKIISLKWKPPGKSNGKLIGIRFEGESNCGCIYSTNTQLISLMLIRIHIYTHKKATLYS